MEIVEQIFVSFLDLLCTAFIIWIPLFHITHFIRQLRIRLKCREKRPGRACVPCRYNYRCDRAMQSMEYRWFACHCGATLEEAQEIIDKGLIEELIREAQADK